MDNVRFPDVVLPVDKEPTGVTPAIVTSVGPVPTTRGSAMRLWPTPKSVYRRFKVALELKWLGAFTVEREHDDRY